MNLSKCKMMLDDLTRVTMTRSELLKLNSDTSYTYEQINSVTDDIVLDDTPENRKVNNAKISNLQDVVNKQINQQWLQVELRQEVSRLIKLHEESYNDAANV